MEIKYDDEYKVISSSDDLLLLNLEQFAAFASR